MADRIRSPPNTLNGPAPERRANYQTI